jgi:hypothetical protein
VTCEWSLVPVESGTRPRLRSARRETSSRPSPTRYSSLSAAIGSIREPAAREHKGLQTDCQRHSASVLTTLRSGAGRCRNALLLGQQRNGHVKLARTSGRKFAC